MAVNPCTNDLQVKVCGTVLEQAKVKGVARRWAPTMIGLGIIPLIVHPIDTLVHFTMDHTIRPAFFTGAGADRPDDAS